MDEVEKFIKRRFGDTDAHWLDGNCYFFSVILCDRFPNLQKYYEPIVGHFVAGDGVNFYDATGKYSGEYTPYLLSELSKEDPEWVEQLLKDCAM